MKKSNLMQVRLFCTSKYRAMPTDVLMKKFNCLLRFNHKQISQFLMDSTITNQKTYTSIIIKKDGAVH